MEMMDIFKKNPKTIFIFFEEINSLLKNKRTF